MQDEKWHEFEKKCIYEQLRCDRIAYYRRPLSNATIAYFTSKGYSVTYDSWKDMSIIK